MTDTTRRAVLAGSAAMPALALPAVATAGSDDPVIAAVRRWVEADKAERDYYAPDDGEDDPRAQELETETSRRHWGMAQTAPTTIEGLALLLAAALFDREGSHARGTRIEAPETWGLFETWYDGRDCALLRTAMSSPVGAALVRRAVA